MLFPLRGGPSSSPCEPQATSCSTSRGASRVDEAASVAAAAALDFLGSPLRRNVAGLLVVLAAEGGSNALEALRKHVPSSAEQTGERRLVVRACALPDVGRDGTPCACIVNPCNWRLSEGGSRTNMLVHRAAGDCLRKASLDGRTRAFVAEPFPVQIPQDSPLRAEGGVRTVIQVLGPNLDPRFPECLHDKPEEARRLLRVSYDRALECFWDLTTRSVPLGAGAAFSVAGSTLTDETIPRGVKWPVEDPVTVGGRAAGGDVSAESGAIKRAGDESSATGAATRPRSSPDSFPAYRRDKALPASSGKGGGSWKNALYHYLRQPRSPSLQAGVFYEDECCVVVYDGYPKSRFHLLLLAKKEVLDVKTPSALRTEHLPVLRRLHAVGEAVAQALKQQGAGAVRCGYHSIPSLDPLHLHIISQDFDAPRLKRKSHWNSFTTDFFLGTSWVEARLEERGCLDLDIDRYKRLEAQPLRCFRCGRVMANMPALKEHNRACIR